MPKKIASTIMLLAFIIPASLLADGYDYDFVGQITAQTMKWITGSVSTIIGIVGLIIAGWKWKVSGNHNIIVIAIFAIMIILGAATIVDTQKNFTASWFQKAADSNGSFK